jgi:hypothetical protein
MEYSSFSDITENFHFLKNMVVNLSNDNFEFMSVDEVLKTKEEIINELSMDASFKQLAMFEARLRTDYNVVLSTKKKDPLSTKFMDLCRDHRDRVKNFDEPLDKLCRKIKFEQLVSVVRDYLKESDNSIHRDCSVLKGHLKFRHWYAHGRYFIHTTTVPDPEDLENTCQDIISTIENRY